MLYLISPSLLLYMRQLAIIEDNKFLLSGYKEFLDYFPDLSVKIAVTSLEDFMIAFKKSVTEPDYILVDINVIGFGGLDGITYIKNMLPDTKIIVITNQNTEQTIINAFKNGASSFIVKDQKLHDIYQAIKDVEMYGAYISPSAAKALVCSFRNKSSINYESLLTRREVELARLVVKGMSYKEMAECLNISHFTVNHHLKKMYQKLDVRSKAELVYKLSNNESEVGSQKTTLLSSYRLQIA